MERYIINRKLILGNVVERETDQVLVDLKTDIYIPVKIPMEFTTIGIDDTTPNLIDFETEKIITPFVDGEQTAYKFIDSSGCTVNFRFYNKTTGEFEQDYGAVGFNTTTGLTKSSFLRSFFRLYFYDKNELENRNLLFFEELDVTGTIQPSLNLKRIYFYRNYKDFVGTNNDKNLYVIGRFFNASTGKVHDFINTPLNYTAPINITEFSQNPEWWSSPITVINPNNNNGDYNFSVVNSIGSNTTNTITLTEQVIR
jgi:hypothetical protein